MLHVWTYAGVLVAHENGCWHVLAEAGVEADAEAATEAEAEAVDSCTSRFAVPVYHLRVFCGDPVT